MPTTVKIVRATHVVGDKPEDFDTSPTCAESWCRWVFMDSIAYAAREGPRAITGATRRKPLALPSLGGEIVTCVLSGEPTLSDEQKKRIADNRRASQSRKVSKRTLSGEQKDRIADNRRAAQSRKADRQLAAELPVQSHEWEEEEDVFGHQFSGTGDR